MLSLYRAWLGPGPCVARPAPPPGAHRPVPRRPALRPPSPSSTTDSEVDVEHVDEPQTTGERQSGPGAVVDVASCDGPVRFSRVLNEAWRERAEPGWCRHRKRSAPLQCYPCKTCGCKFPSYYFVHKHRKRCHGEDTAPDPEPSTSAGKQ